MSTQKQIEDYIAGQPEPKRGDMQALHRIIRRAMPGCRLWFMDGKGSDNRTVTNPNIGYGLYTIRYADGTEREFYNIGMSANTTGISVYVMGIRDRKYLPTMYAKTLGKASVTGYCIKFKTLSDIDLKVLEAAIRDGVKAAGDS